MQRRVANLLSLQAQIPEDYRFALHVLLQHGQRALLHAGQEKLRPHAVALLQVPDIHLRGIDESDHLVVHLRDHAHLREDVVIRVCEGLRYIYPSFGLLVKRRMRVYILDFEARILRHQLQEQNEHPLWGISLQELVHFNHVAEPESLLFLLLFHRLVVVGLDTDTEDRVVAMVLDPIQRILYPCGPLKKVDTSEDTERCHIGEQLVQQPVKQLHILKVARKIGRLPCFFHLNTEALPFLVLHALGSRNMIVDPE
mmetsp:Transcript_31843/g.51585  ORF Transcript_31843/g.51585 Transcript_31843/m.51585 type:complete len:255 (-) Transcript_31843:1688-2452(-)